MCLCLGFKHTTTTTTTKVVKWLKRLNNSVYISLLVLIINLYSFKTRAQAKKYQIQISNCYYILFLLLY